MLPVMSKSCLAFKKLAAFFPICVVVCPCPRRSFICVLYVLGGSDLGGGWSVSRSYLLFVTFVPIKLLILIILTSPVQSVYLAPTSIINMVVRGIKTLTSCTDVPCSSLGKRGCSPVCHIFGKDFTVCLLLMY